MGYRCCYVHLQAETLAGQVDLFVTADIDPAYGGAFAGTICEHHLVGISRLTSCRLGRTSASSLRLLKSGSVSFRQQS
jgi:hypothetical protein